MKIDLYAETPAGKKWIFELKYKKKKIWNTEIKKFSDNIEIWTQKKIPIWLFGLIK